MLKKDYLQRKIEEFGKALALLVSKKKQLDFGKELNSLTHQYLKKDLKEIEQLNEEIFIQNYLREPLPDRIELRITADLLYETLINRLETQEAETLALLSKKCFLLYRFLQSELTENEYDIGIHYKLEMLEKLQAGTEDLN